MRDRKMAAGNVQIIFGDSRFDDSDSETDEPTGALSSSSTSPALTTTDTAHADLSPGSATTAAAAPSRATTTVYDSGDYGVKVKRAVVGEVRFGEDVGENRHYWFGDSDDDANEVDVGEDDAREQEARDATQATCSACDDVAYNEGELTNCAHCHEDHSTACCETLGYDEESHPSLPPEAAPLIRRFMRRAAEEARLEMAHALAEARAASGTADSDSDDEQSINPGQGWKMTLDSSSLAGKAKGRALAGLALMEKHKAGGHPGVAEFSDTDNDSNDGGDADRIMMVMTTSVMPQ